MHIKAFTIVELLVSMIIASILLTLIWNVFFGVNMFRANIDSRGTFFTEASRIEYMIKHDLSGAEQLNWTSQQLFMLGEDTVVYSFDAGYVVRNSIRSLDTLMSNAHVEINECLGKVCVCLSRERDFCFAISKMESSTQKLRMKE